jgi:peptidoglycan hydrolase-like protein with peptidoglycan-binding domain
MIISHYKIFIMKKFILGAAVLGFAFVASSASALENYGGTLIKLGSRGEAVKTVQMCLSEMGYSNAGSFDGIYGTKTLAQVKSYQADKNLAQDGVVGPLTWAALDCEGTDDTDTTTPEFDSSNGEEADVTVDNLKKVDDLSNNKADQEAFTFEVEADEQGGAAQVERADLTFEVTPKNSGTASATDDGEYDVYDVIEKVTIEVDGKEVASMDSSDDDDWQDINTDNTVSATLEEGILRISGLDTVVASDEVVEFTVLLDIADLDETDDLDLDIALTDIEVRYTDEAGITDTESYVGSSKTVTVEALDAVTVDVDENKDNPENTTVALDTDQDAVVAFINDVTMEEQDGTLSTITVEFELDAAATASDIDDLVSDATLMFGDEEIDADDINGVGGANPTGFTVEFDMDDMEFSADDEFEMSVELDLQELEDGSAFIGKDLIATDITFEGEDEDGDDFTVTETVDNAPELALSAGALKLEDSSVDGYVEVGSDDDAAKATFKVEVKADGDEDIRIDNFMFSYDNGSDTVTVPVAGYTVTVKDGDGDAVALTAGTTTLATPFEINDGSTEEFTITVFYSAQAAGEYELELASISWTEDTLGNGFALGTTPGSLTVSLEAEEIDLVSSL